VAEAMPRRGELSIRDLKEVYGSTLASMSDVDVLVLDESGGMPIATRVELGRRPWGCRARPAVVCPTCFEPRDRLIARGGKLQCIRCHGYLTRHQQEKHRAAWVRRGAREEDRVLRLLQPAVEPTESSVREACRLVQELVVADRARLEVLRRRLGDLSVYMSSSR
jgi:hypothetical protein